MEITTVFVAALIILNVLSLWRMFVWVGHAQRDGLTGLHNHKFFVETVRKAVGAKNGESLVSLILLDIDDFKIINDTYGHWVGDLVLQFVAGVLNRHLRLSAGHRNPDIAARYGGEEFGVLLPETSREQAVIIAERLRAEIEAESEKATFTNNPDQKIKVTVSIGVVSAPEDVPAGVVEVLIEEADLRLYRAKRTGKNRVVSG